MGLSDIVERIRAAERAAGRPDGAVTLVAVSKMQTVDRVEAVLAAGQRLFGENKVQEAEGKWPALIAKYPGTSVHLIGPLQTNKAKAAVGLFDAIHSLDREKLARKIADLAQARGTCPDLFVQVNTGAEPQKAGVMPDGADEFISACRAMDLPLVGLMCIPPVDEAPGEHFAMLRGLAERNGLAGLSMGMSDDFEEAIAAGATHVRVGSAIFGARDYG
jgi:hypothetical protein